MTSQPTNPHDTDPRSEEAMDLETKGSVHEAIGKLIGDDAERDRGRTVKRAGAAAGEDHQQGNKQQP